MTAKTIGDALGEQRTVHAALAAVARELPGIGKDAKSPEGYQYRGIEAITASAGPLLAKHGVVILPVATVTEIVPTPAGKDGWTDVRMSVTWQIIGPDGSSLTATTCGIGRDRSDKGANKAQTQAYKYLLLPLLHVADRDDDAEAADTREAADTSVDEDRAADVRAFIGSLNAGQRTHVKSALDLHVDATAREVALALHAPGRLEFAKKALQPKAATT